MFGITEKVRLGKCLHLLFNSSAESTVESQTSTIRIQNKQVPRNSWSWRAQKQDSKCITAATNDHKNKALFQQVKAFFLSISPPLTLPPSLAHLFCLFSPHFSDPLLPHLTSHLPTTSPHLSSPQHSFSSLLPPALPCFLTSKSPSPSLLPVHGLLLFAYNSLVNNSTAVHTWMVIVELHMGYLADKWSIRVEELKTSPRLHYRARRICRLPGWSSTESLSFLPLP